MCVILVSPTGQPFDTSELERAQTHNPDGVGLAWREGDLVRWTKFPKFDAKLWRQPKGACILHFRMATAGGSGMDLAHPFPISRSAGLRRSGVAKRVLFHNGHLWGWEDDARDLIPNKKRRLGAWSDSRMLAYCAHRFGDSKIRQVCKDTAQRVAIFDSDSIGIFGDWARTDSDGIIRSNLSHMVSYAADYWTDWDSVPTRRTSGKPNADRECLSLQPETHREHLCLTCNAVRCVDCYSWGECIMHQTVQLFVEQQPGYTPRSGHTALAHYDGDAERYSG
jgi:hypothetical protein